MLGEGKDGAMIRHATIKDASKIAEILVFTKQMNYRRIFRKNYEE